MKNIYVIGGLELNEDTKEVSVDGEPVKVTPTEYKILLLLMKHAGRVFSAEEIHEWVWQERAVNTDTIMVHVRNIREKIEINPKEPKYLKVVWGVGYKIENRHKLAIVLILLIIAIPTMAVLPDIVHIHRKVKIFRMNWMKQRFVLPIFGRICMGKLYSLFYRIRCGNVQSRERAGARV